MLAGYYAGAAGYEEKSGTYSLLATSHNVHLVLIVC